MNIQVYLLTSGLENCNFHLGKSKTMIRKTTKKGRIRIGESKKERLSVADCDILLRLGGAKMNLFIHLINRRIDTLEPKWLSSVLHRVLV